MENSDDLGELKCFENSVQNTRYSHKILLENSAKLFNAFKKCPDIIVDFKLFDSDIVNTIFAPSQIDEVNNYLRENLGSTLMEFRKLKSNDISVNRLEFLCRLGLLYLNFKDETIQNYLLLLYQKTLNLPEKFRNNIIYTFIVKFTAKLASNALDIPMPMVVISNYRYNSDELMESVYGNFSHKLNVITINERFINEDEDNCNKNTFPVSKLSSVLHTVVHEVRHAKQKNDSQEKRYNEKSYIYANRILFNEFLCNQEYDEYKKNYNYTEIELDAELYSWLFASKIINTMCPNESEENKCLLNYYYTKYKKCLNIKKDKNNNWYQGYKYNIEFLEDILISNPQKLKYYPVLKVFFKNNGKIKDLNSLFSDYKVVKTKFKNVNLTSVVNMYANYHFQNMTISDLDFSKSDDANILMNKLLDVILNELNSLKKSIILFLEPDISYMEFVNCERIDDLMKLFDILMYNKKVLLGINDDKIKRKLDMVKKIFADIKCEIKHNKNIKNSQLSYNINKLNRVKYNSLFKM